MIQAECLSGVEFRLRARRARHRAPERLGELHDRSSDSGSNGVDQHMFSRLEPSAGAHRVMRGHEDLGNTTRFDEIEVRRYDRGVDRRDDEIFGLRTAATDAEDGRADGRLVDIGSARVDDPRELEARNIHGTPRRSGIKTQPLQEICPVQAGAVDANPDLAGTGFGDRPVLHGDGGVSGGDHTAHPSDRTRGSMFGVACGRGRPLDRG